MFEGTKGQQVPPPLFSASQPCHKLCCFGSAPGPWLHPCSGLLLSHCRSIRGCCSHAQGRCACWLEGLPHAQTAPCPNNSATMCGPWPVVCSLFAVLCVWSCLDGVWCTALHALQKRFIARYDFRGLCVRRLCVNSFCFFHNWVLHPSMGTSPTLRSHKRMTLVPGCTAPYRRGR